MNSTSENTCPKCGTPLSKDAPHGLCPRCLGALNFETQTQIAPDSEKRTAEPPLSPAELSALFPQLEILEFIGKGGMGTVYKARQKKLNRIVALKILSPRTGKDTHFAERFTREARALAHLNHPGIVTLYEFGEVTMTPGNEPSGPTAQPPASASEASTPPLYYFLMEYVDGVNLRRLLSGGRISPREALTIVPQICDALQYAHDQGIVHRDIKPENMLLDRKGRVKVADFGIAKLIRSVEDQGVGKPGLQSSGSLTEVGGSVGTPSYMAPEQRERPNEVDHRADIYALGIVFYEMLTGELPGEKFVPPSSKVRVDVRLDDIVLQALERAPERRYQHVSEVKTAVNHVVETPPRMPSTPAPTGTAAGLHQPNEALKASRSGWKLVAVLVAAAMCLLAIPVVAVLLAIAVPAFVKSRARAPQQGKIQPVEEYAKPASPARPSVGIWEQEASAPLAGRAGNTAVWTGNEMIVFGGEGMQVTFEDGARYNLQTKQWAALALDSASPSARTAFTALWTGTEMMVWGGFGGSVGNDVLRNDGGRFDPAASTWKPISTYQAPGPRFGHVSVWTGKEMLVWGGYTDSHSWYAGGRAPGHLNTGGRYDPTTDSWREITTAGAPSPRFYHTAVWTGREMLVWGGSNAGKSFNDGGLYDPVADSWRPVSREHAPSARGLHAAVWTGREMIVWGGKARNTEEYFTEGGRYNPETDSWTPISTNGAPIGRILTLAVWTGRQMLVWGGVNDAQNAGRLVDESPVFEGRSHSIMNNAQTMNHAPNTGRFVGTGGLYDPAKDQWTTITTTEAPSARMTSGVWTGDSLLSFGGYNRMHLNETFRLRLKSAEMPGGNRPTRSPGRPVLR